MKRLISAAAVAVVAVGMMSCDTGSGQTQVAKELTTPEQKFAYAIGLDIGNSLKRLPTDLDLSAVFKGIEDTLKGKSIALSAEEIQSVRNEFFQKMEAEESKKQAVAGDSNKVAGEKFLEENKKNPDVKVTASGLQYTVITEGKGPKPLLTDMVTVHYKGTLLNGKVFDESYGRGQPATFRLDQVIPGWTEGVQLMNVGSKYKFFIPSQLGYGPRGAGQDIGPNATLIFEVELLEIKKGE